MLTVFQTGLAEFDCGGAKTSAPSKWSNPADKQANSKCWIHADDFGMLMLGVTETCTWFTVSSAV